MEEFDEDFRYIISKKNLTLLLDRENVAVNQKSKNGSESAAQKISKYFSMLEESVRLDLYNLYKIDFELFGYDASEFLWTSILCLGIHISLYTLVTSCFGLKGDNFNLY